MFKCSFGVRQKRSHLDSSRTLTSNLNVLCDHELMLSSHALKQDF